jgi:hypothetical protein
MKDEGFGFMYKTRIEGKHLHFVGCSFFDDTDIIQYVQPGGYFQILAMRTQAAMDTCVGSQTQDRSKVKPGLMRKDTRSSGSDSLQQGKEDVFTNSDQPRGKTKKSSLLHLTSTE